MITPMGNQSTTNNGFISHTLHQLKQSTVPLFQDYIWKLHITYQKGQHSKMTPASLLKDVKDKIRVLKHSVEWTTSEPPKPSAMAFLTQPNPTVLEELLKQWMSLLTKTLEQKMNDNHTNPYRKWKCNAPSNTQDICWHNRNFFHWCTKWNNGQGE